MSRHHTASPGKYPDRSEARPARTWSSTTPGKHTIRHGVTVHPRGLGKPTHRVSKRRDFWNYRAGVMSAPPHGPDSTPSEEKRESGPKREDSEPTSTHAGVSASGSGGHVAVGVRWNTTLVVTASPGTPLPSCLPSRETCAAIASPATLAGNHRVRGFAASAFSEPPQRWHASTGRNRSHKGRAQRRPHGHRLPTLRTHPPTRL